MIKNSKGHINRFIRDSFGAVTATAIQTEREELSVQNRASEPSIDYIIFLLSWERGIFSTPYLEK